MNGRFRRLALLAVILAILLALTGSAIGQAGSPERAQIYRFIRQEDTTRAGDIRWIEIWESRDETQNARQVTMIDARGGPDGVEVTCYYAVSYGAGVPLYMVNDAIVPVASADMLWEQLENRRLTAQSEQYVNHLDCQPEGIGTVNGIESQVCAFANQDAATLFLIKPPATSSGELWTAVAGGYPVRYQFAAQGTDSSVLHEYDLLVPPSDYRILPPENASLLCFEEGFPLNEAIHPLNRGNLTFAAFESSLTVDELRRFYDGQLLPAWQPVDTALPGAQTYTRTLETGTECRLTLRYNPQAAGGTQFSAEVYLTAVDPDRLPVPEGFPEPVVVSSNTGLATVEQGVEATANAYRADMTADGWQIREALTDIRPDSAFLTFERDGYTLHVIVDGTAQSATVRLQTRPTACGETFPVDPAVGP